MVIVFGFSKHINTRTVRRTNIFVLRLLKFSRFRYKELMRYAILYIGFLPDINRKSSYFI